MLLGQMLEISSWFGSGQDLEVRHELQTSPSEPMWNLFHACSKGKCHMIHPK